MRCNKGTLPGVEFEWDIGVQGGGNNTSATRVPLTGGDLDKKIDCDSHVWMVNMQLTYKQI